MADEFGPVETRIRERLVDDQPYACIVDLAREIDKLNVVPEKVKERRNLTAQEMKFMQRFGWEFNPNLLAVKREIETGKVLAREGDETWDRDLKVAGE